MIHSAAEIEKYAAWVLGMVVAVSVFFQAHVSLPGGVINLNLADPFAMLALAAVSLHVLHTGEGPVWRVERCNSALLAISLLMLLGFIRGWLEIGVTQWALVGRLLGWLVLLGYLSAGYLIVVNVGTHGLRRFAETMIATAAVVVMMQVVLRLLDHWNVPINTQLTSNFEGYAGNRNAFAFQLLVVMALLLGYSQVYVRCGPGAVRRARPWIFPLFLGIVLVALVWTGSRTGIVVGGLLLFFAGLSRLADRRMLGWGLIFAVLFWFGVWFAEQNEFVQGFVSWDRLSFGGSTANPLTPNSVRDAPLSNEEHRQTLLHGLELWRLSPVLGAGLGVFNAKSSMWFGYPQVIHSTPLWILVEFGLLGVSVFGWGFFQLARHAVRLGKTQPSRRIALFLLLVFSMFGLVHEIFYQRIFWLVLGAVLAQPCPNRPHA
jgi:hypothetical protein